MSFLISYFSANYSRVVLAEYNVHKIEQNTIGKWYVCAVQSLVFSFVPLDSRSGLSAPRRQLIISGPLAQWVQLVD